MESTFADFGSPIFNIDIKQQTIKSDKFDVERNATKNWVFISYGQKNSDLTIYKLNSDQVMSFESVINHRSFSFEKKETFYITAIKNLRKKIRFMNLNFEYQNDDITAEEFEKELNDNSENYFVTVSLLKKNSDLEILSEIISKIDDDITVDEVSDIFSTDISTNQNYLLSTIK